MSLTNEDKQVLTQLHLDKCRITMLSMMFRVRI